MGSIKYKRVLLTGAAGKLGQILRARLAAKVEHLRCTDITEMTAPQGNEELVVADLADPAVAAPLVKDIDAIVHFGGLSSEARFADINRINIVATQQLYEAARLAGVQRIVFASSNHAVGFYDQCDVIDANSPTRPDSFYGLSKVFTENLAQLYWDRFGLETVSLRIGSCEEHPTEQRHLLTWLSYPDLWQLVERSLTVPRTRHAIVFAASNNAGGFWDNRCAAFLGYRPQDSAEEFDRDSLNLDPDKNSPANHFQGGNFTR